MKLGKIDLKILSALQKDGRMTKLRLAEAVDLSPTACWERLSRLEKEGVITGYTARINMDKLERRTTVLLEIMLKSHQQADFQRFEAAVLKEPAIISCDATGGRGRLYSQGRLGGYRCLPEIDRQAAPA